MDLGLTKLPPTYPILTGEESGNKNSTLRTKAKKSAEIYCLIDKEEVEGSYYNYY